MRVATWIVLMLAVAASLAVGRLDVALALAGFKALIVGLEFMELRHAARVHLAGYCVFVVAVVLVLEWMIRV